MTRKTIVNGVYPTMVTPFREDLTIDDEALHNLIEWYISQGIDGLFAVCQSSAMFELSRSERKNLCSKVVQFADKRCPVMASGHISDTIDNQIEDLLDMVEAGAEAIVLVSNRLAQPWENDRVWLNNLETILSVMPADIPLGIYECPYPYKRELSLDIVKELICMKRFQFVKDTCCKPDVIKQRASLAKGTTLQLFNANAATLLFSLKNGYAGYSGIMTNFHCNLYYLLCHNWKALNDYADELQDFLGMASVIEYQSYPANAKYSLTLNRIFSNYVCRRQDARLTQLTDSQKLETEQLFRLSQKMYSYFNSYVDEP